MTAVIWSVVMVTAGDLGAAALDALGPSPVGTSIAVGTTSLLWLTVTVLRRRRPGGAASDAARVVMDRS